MVKRLVKKPVAIITTRVEKVFVQVRNKLSHRKKENTKKPIDPQM